MPGMADDGGRPPMKYEMYDIIMPCMITDEVNSILARKEKVK